MCLAAAPPPHLPNHDSLAVAKAKQVIKDLSPEARAYVLAWMVKFYNDSGAMFSPQVTQNRRRVIIDDQAFWLVKVPTK